jgi:hypothetical protein
MGVIIILFFIAIILAFGVLCFRAWQIKTLQTEPETHQRELMPEIYFRHVEKIVLHLAKYAVQWIVLVIVKYWFIVYTKVKNWGVKNWPKVYRFFRRSPEDSENPQKYTFFQRAKLELKAKIRHTKEKVRREQLEEEKVEEKIDSPNLKV